MWLVFWLLLFVIAACLVFLMPALWEREIYNHYSGSRAVSCPETHRPVAVSFDALHAAITGFFAKPELRLSKCTLWPMSVHCGQECIPEASRTVPYTRGEVAPPKTKQIYHLPVLIAAFAAFVFGVFWHSQHLFRVPWREAFGLNWAQLRPMVWWWTPQLLSMAICLLFAYGVAWLLAVRGRRGVGQGMITSTFLWAAVAAASVAFAGGNGIPGEVLRIEISYTFLASAIIGAIVGGLTGKLIVSAAE
jgi:hypothetical protein